MKKKSRFLRKSLATFALLTVGYLLLSLYVDNALAQRAYAGVYKSCHKVWATRGLVVDRRPDDSKAGNSVASIDRAFEAGAEGTEVDVYYDVELGKFAVSHDRPYNVDTDGNPLFLDQLFEAIQSQQHYYWLDFKKLGKLSRDQARQAVARLDAITHARGLKPYIYIEGEDPINLSVFRKAGFNTIFDSQPLPETYPLTHFILGVYKLAYYFGDFTVMSMNAGDTEAPIYGDVARRSLRHVPVFIYHVPEDPEALEPLLANDNVRVIILRDHGSNKYSINACASSE